MGNRLQKQSEALAYPHAEGQQQAGSNQNQPSLARARDDRCGGCHATSMRTAMAALAMTAESLCSGSATSRPPLTARTVTLPIGSDVLTASRITRSGRWTPTVTSTSSLLRSIANERMNDSEL